VRVSTHPFDSPEEYEAYYGYPPENSSDVADQPGQPPRFDNEAWEARGKELGERHAAAVEENVRKLDWCRWNIGDWLVEGAMHYGEIDCGVEVVHGYRIERPPDVYSVAEQITGLKRYTLKDLSSTARRIPASVRTDACSWTHHRRLRNALPKADENTLRQWLQRAVAEKMSVSKLLKAIRSPKGVLVTSKTFRVTILVNTWETLRDFADYEGCTVQKIAAQWIDEHARLEETQAFRKAAKKNTEDRRYQKRRRVGLKVAETYDNLGLRKPGGQNHIGEE